MLKGSTPVSDKYIPAMQGALFWKALFFCLSALILDFFYTNHMVIVAVMAHWIGIVTVIVKRPASPTSVDLFFCRAFPLVFGITMVLAPIIMGGFMGGADYSPLLNRWFGIQPLRDHEFAGSLVLPLALIWVVVYPFLGLRKPKTRTTEPTPPEVSDDQQNLESQGLRLDNGG